jgi:(1->4)-alpha-D-glucan 1-alpha-D-glucosylmutase
MLWKLYSADEQIRAYVEATVETLNGQKAPGGQQVNLDGLLSQQFFRLSFWKVASEELNYRRFFAINDLISLAVEDEAVMLHTHELLLKLAQAGVFSGLRVDHIDGLYDPAVYLQRLRARLPEAYIVVEKILAMGERLPDWPVQGTTGYDFLNNVNGVFCQQKSAATLTAAFSRLIGRQEDFWQIGYESKRMIIQWQMAGDIDNLAHLMKRVASHHRYGRDITLYGLRRALVEVMAFFPVYRTYIDRFEVEPADEAVIRDAVAKARARSPALLYELEFIDHFLRLRFAEPLSEDDKAQLLHFVMRFQQFTGPLMAKGFEDTALYVYNRLVSLNEVGGDPGRFGIALDEFHRFNAERQASQPHSMNASATHDTKRGEDVRARLNVLSELAEEWMLQVDRWRQLNQGLKKVVGSQAAPDIDDEYLLYQSLLGALPFGDWRDSSFVKRLQDYIIKAIREAKIHTAWVEPDTAYEGACTSFVAAILSPSRDNPFLAAFLPFQKRIAFYGLLNSLSQTLIKLSCPGVPDIYQGCELWDLSLVDPDNRRPVDYGLRQRLLGRIREGLGGQNVPALLDYLLSTAESGAVKLFLIHRGLAARRAHAELFDRGGYVPLTVAGMHAESLIAFGRSLGERWAITVVPRLLTGVVRQGEFPLGRTVWGDTAIQLSAGLAGRWQDALSGRVIDCGESLAAGEALAQFPAALLLRQTA